jgi:isoleucyl-tRNA synthetase
MFRDVAPRENFPALEERILKFWQEIGAFRESVARRAGGPSYVFYEGPPTANGRPHVGHVLTRVMKDIFPRYKTMRGYYCERKGGWDTHGLPVEIEVEKELGLTGKPQIEAYGVAAFNQKCRESVFRYVEDWVRLTDRIGFWIDMDDPYVTLHNGYIESVWWTIKQIWDKGWIYQDYKVVPYCPRCGTALSSHEVSLGYDETDDPSIYVKMPLTEPFEGGPAAILVWTTTPWTLPGNVALAVSPDLTYALVETAATATGGPPERLVLAEALLDRALRQPYRVLARFPGSALVGRTYEPLYTFIAPDKPAYRVLAADFVSAEDGTGIVHIAPAYGEDDMRLAREQNLPVIETVDLRGAFKEAVTPWAGVFVKDADPAIINELRARGRLYNAETYRHTYPFCWRCATPLLYYAKTAWFAKRTAIRDRLLALNQEINWHPEHIKEGRFGNFLEGIIDWAMSRERYWGTPLPFWHCAACERYECFGSLAELQARALDPAQVPDDLDLHRPYVDDVVLRCAQCGGLMRRVPEVLDVWWDSGAMPYAQWHYPHHDSAGRFQRNFPADFICEAIDQTRGWFLTLHVLGAFLFDSVAFRNVICLELVLDAKGEKMSKSKGNVVDPWEVIERHGADALRWYLTTVTPPWQPRRFSADLVGEALRRFILTLWNTYHFFVLYAKLDGWQPGRGAGVPSDLDRWIRSLLQRTIAEVTAELDDYDPTSAGRAIEAFVDQLSNWYVRRSRRRFWKSGDDADKAAAYATLYECLVTLAKLLAPLTPFLAEELYQNLVRSVDRDAPASVHYCDWPAVDATARDEQLEQDMALIQRLASLARAARSKAGIKVRQPLGELRAYVPTPAERAAVERLAPQLLDEVNVKRLTLVEDVSALLTYSIRPNLPVLGPRLGKDLPAVRQALQAMDPAALLRARRANQPITVAGHTLQPDDYEVVAHGQAGLAVAEESGYAVGLDPTVTPELAAEGLARELVHRFQNARRSAGLQVADRIVAYLAGPAEVAGALERHGDYLRQEVLAQDLRLAEPPPSAYREEQSVDGHRVVLGIERVAG